MKEKVLIIDDEIALQETLAYNLAKEGYDIMVAGDGKNALEKADQFEPDMIILDIMLPGMDGFEVCQQLRKKTNAPILMLTARDDEIDRVVGLEVGADDYLTKPFSMRELIARVKAQLRRMKLLREETSKNEEETTIKRKFTFGNLIIDPSRREILLENTTLSLKPKEYDLMVFFAEHHRQVLTREQILQNVWGWDYFGGSRTIDVHTRWLREKIEKDPEHPLRIVTVRGSGYRFEG
jgi:DNA-binding response OmpR family regulator